VQLFVPEFTCWDPLSVFRYSAAGVKMEASNVDKLIRSEKRGNMFLSFSGSDSVVGIATAYGLDGPEIESRWGRNFPHLSRPALRPTQRPVQWVPGLSRG
jgi:hypothetical protein